MIFSRIRSKTIFKVSFSSSKIQTFGFNRQKSNFPLFLSIEQISIYRYCYKLFFSKNWNFFPVWNFFLSIFTPKNQNARFSFEIFNFSIIIVKNVQKPKKTNHNTFIMSFPSTCWFNGCHLADAAMKTVVVPDFKLNSVNICSGFSL